MENVCRLAEARLDVVQGKAAELEQRLREKEQEIVRLRIALESSKVKAEDDEVGPLFPCSSFFPVQRVV
jgi:hypothetical protein